MTKIFNYRSLMAAGVVSLAAMNVGCGGSAGAPSLLGGFGTDHTSQAKKTMKQGYDHARLMIVLQLASQQYEAGEYDKCKETLSAALAAGAADARLSILASKCEIEKGNLDIAYGHLKNAQGLDANNAEGFYLMGVVYQRWQKYDQSLDMYQLAWERKGSEPSYLLAVVEILITQNKLEEARQALETNMDFFEQTAAVRVAMGKIYTLKGDYKMASKFYREAVVLNPDDLALRMTYAESLYFAGKYTEALPVLEDLRRNRDTTDKASVTMILGRCYLSLHRNSDARFCFQDLTQENPTNTIAWLSLGRVYLQDGEPVMTIQTTARVLKYEPGNVQAMILKALAEQKQQRWSAARETLEKASAIAPKDSTVLCMLGITAQNSNDKVTAIDYFERAVAVNPKDTWAAELLAAAKPVAIKIDEPAPVIEKIDTPAVEEPKSNLPASPVEETKATPSEPIPHMDQR